MPPDDPFGRGGPNLETFLRKQKPNHCQPCPYEKKCTYGNKCKYYHPDRGPQPQKSISEELKENSSKKINEVRARSPSDDHLGKVVEISVDLAFLSFQNLKNTEKISQLFHNLFKL